MRDHENFLKLYQKKLSKKHVVPLLVSDGANVSGLRFEESNANVFCGLLTLILISVLRLLDLLSRMKAVSSFSILKKFRLFS